MKKLASAVAALLLAALLLITGCGLQSNTVKSDKISVVATIFAPYDFARAVAKDKADIAMLLPPGSEAHSFEPTPQDIIKIQNCDVFIYVGGESDEWVGDILESVDTSKMKIITLMDCVEVSEEEITASMKIEEESDADDAEHEYDEHVWTSPKNAKLIVQKIFAALCEVDAANTDIFKQNTIAYLDELDELDGKFQSVVDTAARKTIIFADRFPFRYFTDAYGLDYDAAFPGCSTETEASASTVKSLIDKINAESIPAVFHIELSNEKMANTISEATGAKILLLHSCHNISKSDFEAGKTYIDIMTCNVDSLKEALR